MQSSLLRSNVFCLASPFKLFHFARNSRFQAFQLRSLHDDGRQRLSRFWAPTGGIAPSGGAQEDSHAMLVRGGFVRQAHSGLFQFLPLGLRIQEKIEHLLEKHMTKLGASKVALSTFSSEELWQRSGRFRRNSELFRLTDRKDQNYLLSPTHEEEITSLVDGLVQSYRDLPLMLYQITRKYRDEPRPRQGLLRTREFLMKDLYTFDSDKEQALKTYETVRRTYTAFFDEFKIPYMVAEADSGDIGGDLSHEYHFPTPKGEDNIISCTSCSFVANEETLGNIPIKTHPRVDGSLIQDHTHVPNEEFKSWHGITQSHRTLIEVIYPANLSPSQPAEINPQALKQLFPDLDLSIGNPIDAFLAFWSRSPHRNSAENPPTIHQIFDYRVPSSQIPRSRQITTKLFSTHLPLNFPPDVNLDPNTSHLTHPDLLRLVPGSPCPSCSSGSLKVQTAVELGHTFFLSTKYSDPLSATIAQDPALLPDGETAGTVPMQMGCHGIGVSRLIAAVADALADDAGLNWPRVMAPFEAVVIPYTEHLDVAAELYDMLSSPSNSSTPTSSSSSAPTLSSSSASSAIDTILDDRAKSFVWKLKDADLIGYPVAVLLGKNWKKEGKAEVRCRRLGVQVEVELGGVREVVEGCLGRL